jgi:2-oxo-3-hexenedioate decarboxylase
VQSALPRVEMVLRKGDEIVDRGIGEIVLGSPLSALGHLVELLARQPWAAPLAAGEIISTGTFTDAHPVAPGEAWRTELTGLPLAGLRVRFA